MPASPIRYYDRRNQTLKTELIYGEPWLRFIYENPAGRFLLWLLVRRAIFSRIYGWRMNQRASGRFILPFIVRYYIDVDDFTKSALTFRTFNEFFTRAVKPGRRPISGERTLHSAVHRPLLYRRRRFHQIGAHLPHFQ